jgi:hypothetical protein
MTTKAKCFALAKEHNLEISYAFSSLGKSSSVDLPDGFLLSSTGSTGLCFHTYEATASEFWKAVYGDVETIVMNKSRWLVDTDSQEGAA